MNNHDMKAQARFDKVVDAAQTAFWKAVAAEYTEAESGDVSFETSFNIKRAMRESLAEWTEDNLPETEVKDK